MTIANGGAFPFSGDVQFTDAMFLPDGTALLAPITGIVPALGCVPAPGGLAFSCTAALTLAPGESKAFDITVTMPAAPPAYWAQNCFAVSAPGAVPPALPLAPGADSNMVSCAWVPVGGPPPLINLRLEKTALHGGDCYKVGAATIACDYEIEIFNDGPSPSFGRLSASPMTSPPRRRCPPSRRLGFASVRIPTTCGSGHRRRHPGRRLGHRAGHRHHPAGAARGGRLRACRILRRITAPAGGTPWNFFAGDDSDTAIADAFLEWWTPAGIFVTCDPTNLKVKKVAKGDCVASEGGYRCDYAVTRHQYGSRSLSGRRSRSSSSSALRRSSVKFSPAWGRVGGGANYKLTLPDCRTRQGRERRTQRVGHRSGWPALQAQEHRRS